MAPGVHRMHRMHRCCGGAKLSHWQMANLPDCTGQQQENQESNMVRVFITGMVLIVLGFSELDFLNHMEIYKIFKCMKIMKIYGNILHI